MFAGVQRLKHLGYTPDLILDIGAEIGNWTRHCKTIYNTSKYLLFEAIKYDSLYTLENSFTQVYNELLFNRETEVDWYEAKNTGDSIFKEVSSYFKNCEPVKRKTTTLNNCLKNNIFIEQSKNVLIKIDCQGAEIPILQGASDILPKTDFIILETPLFGVYNQDVPNFLEHIKYMESIGFIVFDILENHYVNGFTMQVDIIFINKNHEFNRIVQDKLTN